MRGIPKSIKRLVDELASLPGVGEKTAQRFAFHLIKSKKDYVDSLSKAISELKDGVVYCSVCFNFSESDPCHICTNEKRNRDMICIVEDAFDVYAIEKTGEYDGLYHVLGGSLSPIDGIGPEDLKIEELALRIKKDKPKEIIFATNPDIEGETTAMYIQKKLSGYKGKITRIANGLPAGSNLEYADEITLSRALEGRREF